MSDGITFGCPKCGAIHNIATERRLDGYSFCKGCGYNAKTKEFWSEKLAIENRIAELESVLCETCKDPACEDSVVEHLKQKVARLEKALREIVDKEYALCYYCKQCDCVKCIAMKALGGGE